MEQASPAKDNKFGKSIKYERMLGCFILRAFVLDLENLIGDVSNKLGQMYYTLFFSAIF